MGPDFKHYRDKDWLFEQYVVKKLSIDEIAALSNIDRTVIHDWLKRHNIPRRSASDSHLKHDVEPYRSYSSLQKLYVEEKKTITAIAKLAKVTSTTVSNWLRKFGIRTRGPSEARKGRFPSEETKQKMRSVMPRGKNHHNWKGGITPLNKQIRTSFMSITWRKNVFLRDCFRCQICHRNKCELQADHIVPFSTLLRNYKITSLEEALKCSALWDISNGRTLCIQCHRKTPTWGNTKNGVRADNP